MPCLELSFAEEQGKTHGRGQWTEDVESWVRWKGDGKFEQGGVNL